MRLAHIITRLIVGGAQENTIASVLGLRAKPGLDVILISGPTSGPEGSLESRVATIPGLLTIVPELVRPVHPWKDAWAWQRLTRLFREYRPNIVHTHSGKAGILGRLAARRAGVPLIIHTVHGPSFGEFQSRRANLLFRAAERYAARFTNHFVVVAQAMANQYLAAGIGRPEHYTRIFSGFALAPFMAAGNSPAERARWGMAESDFVVGKIARLFQLKGHEDLFAIAPRLVQARPNIKFLLVGGGEWRGRFADLTRQLGLEKHVVFTGLVPPDQVPALVGIMDVLVHLSRREGLARALPQALAAGKPVVAYDCDGAREVCLENQTGFLIKPGDLDALAQRLLHVAGDVELRDRLGRGGRTLVQENFSVEKMVNDLYALYLKLLRP